MTHLARLAASIFNTPLLVMPETAMTVANVLGDRVSAVAFGPDDMAAAMEMSRFRGQPSGPQRQDGTRASYYRVDGGVAVVPVLGELCNRGAWIGASSGLTSYEGFGEQMRAASADTAVRGIVLDMNTPGGEAFGAFEAGQLVRKVAAAGKPVVAFVNGMACSAGYAIACGADKIVTIPSGVVGSIGVVMMHLDRTAALAKAGLKPTLIHAGAHKVDTSSLKELPDDARARLQAHVDDTYALFVAMVAEHRGLTPAAVRATEGGVLMGEAGVKAGLADTTGTLDDCFALIDQARPRAGYVFGATMDTITKADHEAALVAARAEGFGAGAQAEKAGSALALAAASSTGAQAERTRIAAIFGLEEAKGREASAQHLALNTDMSADIAKGTLAGLPKAEAAGSLSRMSRAPNPSVLPDGGQQKAEAGPEAWGGIMADLNKEYGAR